MDFSLRYGQSRGRIYERGEPLVMYHRALGPKRAIQLGSASGERLNVQYEGVGGDLAVDITEPLHIAQMYVNGWPALVAPVHDTQGEPPWHEDRGTEIARRGLLALSGGQARAFCTAFAPESERMEISKAIDLAAARIKDPWEFFRVARGSGRFQVSLEEPPYGLVYPRPDIVRAIQRPDSDYWDNGDVETVNALRSLCNDALLRYASLRAYIERTEAARV